jgi:RimJ/RimL family protein N-acetyltransferase
MEPTQADRDGLRAAFIELGRPITDTPRIFFDIPANPAEVIDTIMRPLGIVPNRPDFHHVRLWRADGAAIGFVAVHTVRGADAELFAYAWPGIWTRSVVRHLALWIFGPAGLGLRRLTARAPASDAALRGYLQRLGFKHEGTLRRARGDDDVLIFGMLAEECPWLRLAKVGS